MRFAIWTGCFVAVVALAACEGKDTKPAAVAAASPVKADAHGAKADAPKAGDVAAEQVAAESRGDVKCPATLATAARASGAPIDDVVGVRPGLTYEEAINVVLCDNPMLVVQPETGRGFQIKTFGQTVRQGFNARFAEARVQKTSKQIMQGMQDEATARALNQVRYDIKPGQVKFYVGTMGLPGQERVISVAREEWFQEGHNPTIESVRQALIGKYGSATRDQEFVTGRDLTWAYDPRGRLVTETSPLYETCKIDPNPNAGARLTPDCGTVVAAHIAPLKDNPGLTQYLRVASLNEADGMAAVTATEEALQSQDASRRAKELDDAAKNADKPKL